MADLHEIAAGLRLWLKQGGPATVIDFLIAALDRRDAEAVWETSWDDESPGPGWEPLAPHPDGQNRAGNVPILWRRRVR